MYVQSEEIYGLYSVRQVCFFRVVWIQLSGRAYLSNVSGILGWNKENYICINSLAPLIVCWTFKAGCWKFAGFLNQPAISGEVVPRCSVSWEAEILYYSSLANSYSSLSQTDQSQLSSGSIPPAAAALAMGTGEDPPSPECAHTKRTMTQSIGRTSEALSMLISEQKCPKGHSIHGSPQRQLNWRCFSATTLPFLSTVFFFIIKGGDLVEDL